MSLQLRFCKPIGVPTPRLKNTALKNGRQYKCTWFIHPVLLLSNIMSSCTSIIWIQFMFHSSDTVALPHDCISQCSANMYNEGICWGGRQMLTACGAQLLDPGISGGEASVRKSWGPTTYFTFLSGMGAGLEMLTIIVLKTISRRLKRVLF